MSTSWTVYLTPNPGGSPAVLFRDASASCSEPRVYVSLKQSGTTKFANPFSSGASPTFRSETRIRNRVPARIIGSSPADHSRASPSVYSTSQRKDSSGRRRLSRAQGMNSTIALRAASAPRVAKPQSQRSRSTRTWTLATALPDPYHSPVAVRSTCPQQRDLKRSHSASHPERLRGRFPARKTAPDLRRDGGI